jgi:hypothetical protein
MSESRNVELLKEYHEALQSSDGEKMASMLHPELHYWVSPGSAFSGDHDKASLLSTSTSSWCGRHSALPSKRRWLSPRRRAKAIESSRCGGDRAHGLAVPVS